VSTADARSTHEEKFMRLALQLASEGWGQTAPNPMVGAVVVRDGQVVAQGWHRRYGEAHAEVNALRDAGELARGATLYVTLEPCRHHGKTPPCTDAVLAAGVARVVVAAPDPTAIAGGGAAVLRERGVRVDVGLLEREARELNAPFFHAVGSHRPWTTLKLAVSMETAIADRRGSTTWLTGAESRREVHRLRAGNDAVAVGVGTIVADDARLTVRDWTSPRNPPARVVLDRTLRTPVDAEVVRTARETPTLILTGQLDGTRADAMRQAGVKLLPMQDLSDGLDALRGEGIASILIEGGASIAASALRDGLVNRLVIFQAPVTLGAEALYAFEGTPPEVLDELEMLPVLSRRQLGQDVMTTFSVADD
jgi:diaminohydroxyphosphoribosylaminopyrimidine deaminase/5-amino-6-(5-phosphoribosylamino)uracil reductase